MKTTDAKKRAGGGAALARLLGIKQQSIVGWGDEIPKLREYQLRELKPDWFAKKRQRVVA